MKIIAAWRATKATAMFYVLADNGELYEAWVWNGVDVAPTEVHQEGYRFQLTGEQESWDETRIKL